MAWNFFTLDFARSPRRSSTSCTTPVAVLKAFALVASRPEAEAIGNDLRLFTDVRAAALKILNPDSGESRHRGCNLDTVLGADAQ